MSKPYAFYKSLRFRFGAVFGSVFLAALLMMAFFIYFRVQKQLESAFDQTLKSNAALVLGKTELNPLTIPVPDKQEQFLLTYDNGRVLDTLFPTKIRGIRSLPASTPQRAVDGIRNLETGGRLLIHYSKSAESLTSSINELRSVLFFYLPIAFLISLSAGYRLTGFLLRPIGRLIDQANRNATEREIQFLPVPETEDELHALGQSLNDMLGKLQEVRRQQNAFFSSAAHELRTPLTVMLTGLQVSRMELKEELSLEVIDRQVRLVRRLSGLVDNLLLMGNLASLSRGSVLKTSRQSLAEIALNHIHLLSEKAANKGQRFKVELLPAEADYIVFFHPGHLEIVLRNLLDNAIVHGLDNSIIAVRLSTTPGNPVQCHIVNDSLDRSIDLERLTREFEKGDPFREGFGLGLWIVSELVNMNGGEVRFHFADQQFTANVLFPL